MGGFFKNPRKAIKGAIRSPFKNVVMPVVGTVIATGVVVGVAATVAGGIPFSYTGTYWSESNLHLVQFLLFNIYDLLKRKLRSTLKLRNCKLHL